MPDDGFVIVDAPRPEVDDAETWQRVVRTGLRDEVRQHHFDRGDFVECDTCSAKPGSPPLCAGCLANRHTIGKLKNP